MVGLVARLRFSARARELEEAMQKVSRGQLGVETREEGELVSLQRAFNEMSRSVSARAADLDQKSNQLIQSEKLSALGELSAALAHEVKNPMVGIVGFSQLGLEATSLEEAKEYFALIESDAQRANGILQNLLEFARPQKLELEVLDPNAVVQGAVRLVANQLHLSKVKLTTRYAERLPMIRGNNNQLRQVLLNLMMNAAQALEEAPDKLILVGTSAAQGKVIIEVRDNGPGMPEDTRQKLFQPFFSTKPLGKGTGLGLSVSASIIAHHEGELSVESSPGRGAAFFISLPATGDLPSAATP